MDRTGRWDMGHSETHYKQIEKMTWRGGQPGRIMALRCADN